MFLLIQIFFFIFTFSPLLASCEENSPPKRILVGSPIRQKPAILHEFLESLKRQSQEGYTLDFYFIDDNEVEESRQKLQAFSKERGEGRCLIVDPKETSNE